MGRSKQRKDCSQCGLPLHFARLLRQRFAFIGNAAFIGAPGPAAANARLIERDGSEIDHAVQVEREDRGFRKRRDETRQESRRRVLASVQAVVTHDATVLTRGHGF